MATIDPTRRQDLDAALERNPRDPAWWILKSVRDEEDDNLSAAEQSLIRANEVSRYYVPKWSLAAFYFRHDNRAKFAAAARDALSVGHGEADSLFRMAQRLGFTSDEILLSIVPSDSRKLESYLRLALRDGDVDAAEQATRKLIATGASAQLGAALETCDALFASGKIDRSVQIWNQLGEAGWIHLPRIDPNAGAPLAVDDFGRETLGRGFDWRFATVAGVARSLDDSGLRLEFSGNEPERCDLLRQRIALAPGRRYRATIRYRVDGIAARAGLTVGVRPIAGGPPVLNDLLSSASPDWQDETFEFQAPREAVPLELAVFYARSLGTTRIEGRFWVRSVRLEIVP